MNRQSGGAITWRQLWDATTATTARAEARWLCEEASGYFGSEFVDVFDSPAGEKAVAHLDAMLRRLRAGEPLQYVLGHWSFRQLDLMVDRRVLIPRPETEVVAGQAIALLRELAGESPQRPLLVADLGTGSGALGLSIAAELREGMVQVWLTDNSADALDVARANTAGLGMRGGCVRFAQGEWFDGLPAELRGGLAMVVSNPPYVACGDEVEQVVRDWEPHDALFAGADGLAALRAVIAGSFEWLAPGGWLVLEHGATQALAVRELMVAAGLSDVSTRRDLADRDRVSVGCAIK